MKNAKAVIAALVEAFQKNLGVDGLLEVIYKHGIKDSDSVRYFLEEAIYDEDGNGLIDETVSVFIENEYEAGMEAYDDDFRGGDYDGYFEKQYYQNPAGRCEDAPCCGCCGYM